MDVVNNQEIPPNATIREGKLEARLQLFSSNQIVYFAL